MDPAPPDPAPPAPAVRLLDGGAEAYPRMLAAIGAARTAVHLEVYAFALDVTGARFAAALAGAAVRGVQVKVVVDGVGSARDGRGLALALRRFGVEVRIFNPLRTLFLGRLRRNHRKVLVVDGEVAFVGGINVGDDFAASAPGGPWVDLVAEIHGEPCAWLEARLLRRRTPSPAGPARLWLSGLAGSRPLRRRYLKAIGAARRTLRLAQGYFLPDRRLVRSITAAARRGVDVVLLLQGRSDIPFSRLATRRLYGRLLRAGVRIFEWDRSVLHAKVAAVDGERLLLGSFNLDPFSLANLETLLEVRERGVAREGEAWILRYVAEARAIGPEEAASRSRLRRWLVDVAGYLAGRAARWLGRHMRR
jgi:cardiolipin synthase